MATVPTLKVEIALATTNAYDTAPTWTDVSTYVLDNPGVQISRGRPNEVTDFSPGQCTFTLNNKDGRFSPLNASSPYVGQLLPRKQVRVTATWSGTDYVLFRGFVTGWPQDYDRSKKMAYVPITAVDGLSLLAQTRLVDAYYGYAKYNIGSLLTAFRAFSNRNLVDTETLDTAYSGSSTATAVSALAAGLTGSVAVDFNGSVFSYSGNGSTATTFSYSFWINIPTSMASIAQSLAGDPYCDGFAGGSPLTIQVLDNQVAIQTPDTNGISFTSLVATNPTTLEDGNAHHIVIVSDKAGSGNMSIYVDGALIGSTATGTHRPWMNRIGGIYVGDINAMQGSMQETMIFTKALSASEVLNLYNLGRAVIANSTSTALGFALDAAAWPSTWRTLTGTPYGTCGVPTFEGSLALSEMQAIAHTEWAPMFVGRTGNLTLLSRYEHQTSGSTSATSQVTFSDDGADSPYTNLGYDYDDVYVRNRVTISNDNGDSASASNSSSVSKYGQQDLSVDTRLLSYDQCRTMCYGLLNWLKDPQIRTRPVSLFPQTNVAQWPACLALDLGQRITVQSTPPGVGSQDSRDLLVQQMDWDIHGPSWELTVTGSPVPTSYMVYDTDSYDGSAVYGF